uniref:Cytochrome P450 n=1 Tax=Oryza meridionalis TaxID=40149 RepID=A0A0E0F994_9ORYZ
MDSYYYSMLFVLPPILYVSYHLTRILADKKKPTTHGLKAHPLLGHLPAFVNNSHRFLDWTTELIVGSPEMRMGFWIPGMRTGIITGNPADVEHILRTNFANYPKGEHAIGMLEDFLGHGLFNSDGEQWLWQRKNASYEFSKRSLRRFVVDVVQAEVADRFLPLLCRAAGDGRGGDVVVLDLQEVLQRFGFDTICMVAFGHDPRCLADGGVMEDARSEFMHTFGEAQDLVVGRFFDPIEVSWKIKKWLNVGTEHRLRKAIADVHAFAMDIVRTRRQSASVQDRDDVLSRFVASDEHSDEVLRDIVLSFLIAGRETTASGLSWFFWLLSSRPDVAARIADEVRAVRKATGTRPGEPFGFDALREMHYLHAALTESMRLYPPAPIDSQSCAADDTLPDGTLVRAGWSVTYSAILADKKPTTHGLKAHGSRSWSRCGCTRRRRAALTSTPAARRECSTPRRAALTESMRLYPPAPIDSQSCATDDTLPDGTLVHAGWSVTYSAYAMGRLAAIWGEDCLEYRPERWLGDDGTFQPASPFRFTVFHAGPRMCLGKEMAYVQMKSIVANVLEEFEVDVVKEVAGGGVPEHVLSVTLRMKGGLPVKIRRKTEAY